MKVYTAYLNSSTPYESEISRHLISFKNPQQYEMIWKYINFIEEEIGILFDVAVRYDEIDSTFTDAVHLVEVNDSDWNFTYEDFWIFPIEFKEKPFKDLPIDMIIDRNANVSNRDIIVTNSLTRKQMESIFNKSEMDVNYQGTKDPLASSFDWILFSLHLCPNWMGL